MREELTADMVVELIMKLPPVDQNNLWDRLLKEGVIHDQSKKI